MRPCRCGLFNCRADRVGRGYPGAPQLGSDAHFSATGSTAPLRRTAGTGHPGIRGHRGGRGRCCPPTGGRGCQIPGADPRREEGAGGRVGKVCLAAALEERGEETEK